MLPSDSRNAAQSFASTRQVSTYSVFGSTATVCTQRASLSSKFRMVSAVAPSSSVFTPN